MAQLTYTDPTGLEINLVPFQNGDEALAFFQPLIRSECERRILAIMPAWKQRNVIADLSSGDADVKAAADVEWAKVTTLRAKSNALEASLSSMSDAGFVELDITNDAHWE